LIKDELLQQGEEDSADVLRLELGLFGQTTQCAKTTMLLDMQDVGEERSFFITLDCESSHVIDLAPFGAAFDHTAQQAQVFGTHQLGRLSHSTLDRWEEITLDQVQVSILARRYDEELKRTRSARAVDSVVFIADEQHAVVH
jgi:hypothetical protein